jgi:hypothetical protein
VLYVHRRVLTQHACTVCDRIIAVVAGQKWHSLWSLEKYGDGPQKENFIYNWRVVDWNSVNAKAKEDLEAAAGSNKNTQRGQQQQSQPPVTRLGFELDSETVAMLNELRDAAGGENGWAAEVKGIERDLTFIHGDFHKGNILFQPGGGATADWSDRYNRGTNAGGSATGGWQAALPLPLQPPPQQQQQPSAAEVVLIDWQLFGAGNPAWELNYAMTLGHVEPQHTDTLLSAYYASLINSPTSGGSEGRVKGYTLEHLRRDFLLTCASMFVMLSEGSPDEKIAKLSASSPDTRKEAISDILTLQGCLERLKYYRAQSAAQGGGGGGWMARLFRKDMGPLNRRQGQQAAAEDQEEEEENLGTPLLNRARPASSASSRYKR